MHGRETLSVLMPVHAGVAPLLLERALESVAEQTLPPDELVLVEDGPLSAQLGEVIATYPGVIRRVTLPVNGGPGVANQAGLKVCAGDWVIKADADDISLPNRFASLLELAHETGADVCGSSMLEFDRNEDDISSIRSVPLAHSAIARRMRLNNPFNHPAVMYRRSLALAAGGYPDLRFGEDYDLFARMLQAGARMVNTAEPLVLYRTGPDFVERRRRGATSREEWQLQRRLRSYGVIGRPRMLRNFIVRMGFRTAPRRVTAWTAHRLLSKPTRYPGS